MRWCRRCCWTSAWRWRPRAAVRTCTACCCSAHTGTSRLVPTSAACCGLCTAPIRRPIAAELAGLLNQAMLSLMRLRQPVVVAAGGRVVGGALGLLLAADVVIAAEDARFAPEPPEAGLAPCGGWQALLPRLAGVRRARAGLLLAHEIDAVTARDWGIVTELAPPGGGRARYRERRQAQPCGRPGRAGSGTRGRAYALHRGARWR